MRIVTWNVHGLVGADGRRDPDRIARVLDDLAFDLAGLQEVTSGGPDALRPLTDRLPGRHAAFGPTRTPGGAAFGNAVLSRHPILATRTYDLSVPGREPRGCLRADVALPGTALHFFVAHLGLSARERRCQAGRLLSADVLRDAALSNPLVLAGDFNAFGPGAAVPRWLVRSLTDAARAAGRVGPTFPARFPLLRLDRCYVDAALRVTACEVVATPLVRRASDHLPLVVELELSAAARRPEPARDVEADGVRTELRTEGAPGDRVDPGGAAR
ncbi:MAG: endonuclease/exonuclease/phosphatase family protein [Anaeromyxobacteraceae bacterium]